MCHITLRITDLQLMEAWIIEFFWFSDHQGSVISAATVPGFKTGIKGSLKIFPSYKCILSNRFDSFYQSKHFTCGFIKMGIQIHIQDMFVICIFDILSAYNSTLEFKVIFLHFRVKM